VSCDLLSGRLGSGWGEPSDGGTGVGGQRVAVAWRDLASPLSRRKIVVARGRYGWGAARLIDAVVRDGLGEVAVGVGGDDLVLVRRAVGELRASASKIAPISAHPAAGQRRAEHVSGSVRDHIAMRVPASRLCRAICASVIRGRIVATNCSVSVIGPTQGR
jgi:hypothetical protein